MEPYVWISGVSLFWFANYTLTNNKQINYNYIGEINTLYKKLSNKDEKINLWYANEIKSQENWKNQPMYKRLQQPPPPNCLDIILQSKLPISQYYNPR